MIMAKQEITGNGNEQAGRDLNKTTIFNIPSEQHPLQKMILLIREKVEEDPSFEGFIDDLAYYSMVNIDTIGLEAKLEHANRQDLIERAITLKDLFARKLCKSQLSLVMQHAYAHILAFICTTFNNRIKPAIANGYSIEEIDKMIYKEVIEVVYNSISGFTIDITTEHIQGMLFFLTGKCHIKWSKQ